MMEHSKLSSDNFAKKGDPSLKYSVCEILGEGSYGTVYRGVLVTSRKEFAIKILPYELDGDNLSNISKEIAILRNLQSPYVVSFHENYLFNSEMWIVMECCHGGSLTDLIEITTFQEEEIRAVMAYCCLGLSYLHSRKCIHRDIKSGNILLTLTGKAKIADFGVSAQLSSSIVLRKTVIGSPFYMAPEMIGDSLYDGKADIWSLGITLYELCTGNPPHFDVSPLRAIFLISSKPAPKLPPKKPLKTDDLQMNCDDWSDDLKDFIGCCLKKDVNKRSSAVDLLEHSFIADYVSLIMDNEDRYLDSYDSDSSCGSEEALGLSVLLDLVEDNLPALKDSQRIRQESKSGRLNVLQANKDLLADGDFIANKSRVTLEETLHQNNPIPANPQLSQPLSLPLSLPEKRPPLIDMNSARRDSKPVPTPVPVTLWSEDRPNIDDEWMYGGDSDPLQSTFMRKPDPVSLTDTFRPSALSFRGSKLTPPRASSFSTIASQESPDMGNSMIITPSSSSNSNSNGNSNCSSSSKGANIQSALRQFKETEDTITSKKLAALPPLSACERTHISPRTSLSARGREMQFVDTLDNLTMCTSLSPPRRKSGIARNIGTNIGISIGSNIGNNIGSTIGTGIGIGLCTANGTEAKDQKDQKPFFLTALETTPRRPSSRDVLRSLDLPTNSTTSTTTTTTLECTESFFRVDRSAALFQRDLGPWKPVPDATHDVQEMLNELELEHKAAVYKLESAYQAKRRSLIRKLKKKDIVE